MTFSIQFSDDDDRQDYLVGKVLLGEHQEAFKSTLKDFTRAQYEQQWRDALIVAVRERRTSALFYSVDIREDGVGTLWMYPIVPSEFAGDTAEKKKRLKNFPKTEDAGVYLGERFMSVTVKVSNFERRLYMEFEDGSFGEELALHHLDLDVPERFYGYLDDNMADVSHWYYANTDVEAFLAIK